MAAAGGGGGMAPPAVRLRLSFDYPPPGSPACGSCWLLLEPSQVRLVTDLISLVREKFGFSRRAKLSLFLDGALLPPTESARLVRDNDSLRVKLEEVIGRDSCEKLTNACSHAAKKLKKQHRQRFETSDSESDEKEHRKRKKSKHHFEHLSSQEKNSTNVLDSVTFRKKEKTVTANDCNTHSKSDDSRPPLKKLRKRADTEKEWVTKGDKKKKGRNFEAKDTSQKTKNISPTRHSYRSTAANTTQANTKKGGKSSDFSTSSSDTDDNIADTKEKHSHKTKVASKQINKSQPAPSAFSNKLVAKQNDKRSLKPPVSKMASIRSSNSDSSSTSGEEEEQQSSNLKNKLPIKPKGVVTAAVTAPASKTQPDTSSSDSDSSGSGSFTVKKPTTNTEASQFASTFGLNMSSSDNVRGRGRVHSYWGLGRGRGRGRSENPNFNYNYNNEHNKQQQLHEVATNTSVIIQDFDGIPIAVDGSTFPVLAGMPTTNGEDTCAAINAVIPLDTPKKDYSKLPLLAAPPQVGEKIAFKLLELTESYTPEVSDYKEAKIISWNPDSKQLELELLSFSSVAKEPGKFDLVYESANGAETIEYAVPQDRKLMESWDALIEPRLLVDLPKKELSPKIGTPSDVNTLVPGVNSL